MKKFLLGPNKEIHIKSSKDQQSPPRMYRMNKSSTGIFISAPHQPLIVGLTPCQALAP